MEKWRIELVTNDVVCNMIEIQASYIEKADYHTLIIDGEKWQLPENAIGLSFADIYVDA